MISEKLIELYIDVFLLYLIIRFSTANKNAMSRDDILDKEVPSIVFLQNRKLLKDTVMESFKSDKHRKEEIMRRAQMNEFLYELMRKHKIAIRIDENIGIEFINMNDDAN